MTFLSVVDFMYYCSVYVDYGADLAVHKENGAVFAALECVVLCNCLQRVDQFSDGQRCLFWVDDGKAISRFTRRCKVRNPNKA